MNYYLKAFRRFGFRGVWNYLHNKLKWELKRFIYWCQLICWTRKIEDGITVIGDFYSQGSPSKTLRDFVRALKNSGIPYQTLNTNRTAFVPPSDVVGFLTPDKDFKLGRYSIVIGNMDEPLPVVRGHRMYHICFWEYDTGFMESIFTRLDHAGLLAMSEFNFKCFKEVVGDRVPVAKIRYPFFPGYSEISSRGEILGRFGVPKDAFVVLFVFGLGGGRKNYEGTIEAYSKAFRNVKNCRLMFKVYNRPDAYGEQLEMIRAKANACGIADQFVLITEYLQEKDIYGLMGACDVYISLHHGEGFGITMAEAMSMGKPVVATNWSANTEFTTAEAAIPIDYTLTPIRPYGSDYAIHYAVTRWADPDIDMAAGALRKCFEDPFYRKQKGDTARAYIADYFSKDNLDKSLRELLTN